MDLGWGISGFGRGIGDAVQLRIPRVQRDPCLRAHLPCAEERVRPAARHPPRRRGAAPHRAKLQALPHGDDEHGRHGERDGAAAVVEGECRHSEEEVGGAHGLAKPQLQEVWGGVRVWRGVGWGLGQEVWGGDGDIGPTATVQFPLPIPPAPLELHTCSVGQLKGHSRGTPYFEMTLYI